ncbi:MAG: ATP-binding cassette domain-containing protein [bacterium]|nr:ATP-binding cassette domain-containing protein [bacterium]
MKVLEVENIKKSFGKFQAVNDVTFGIDEGSVFGLLGPNGAGKTTTIRMVMNIIMPDSGKVSILGKNNYDESSPFIGYLPEERGLYRKMKVGELLLFLTELKEMNRKEAKKQVDHWLDRMGLMEWKKKKIEELSKGMQQKIQFIGTIVHNPKLLILDEPFGGLDPINTNLIKDIMIELKGKGTTIIFSTHQMESAEKLCEEIFLINKGENVLSGKLRDIKENFGKKNIHLSYDGKDDFLLNTKLIKKHDNYGNYVEIQLEEGADPQELLGLVMASAKISKFEIKEPSLNEIFIETVEGTNGEDKS